MKQIIYCVLILFIAVFSTVYASAQSGTYYTIRDFETWSSINLKYKPTKNLKVNLSQQLRLKDNSTSVNAYFTQFGIDYKLSDFVNIAVASRLVNENDDQGKIQGKENHFRWQTDLKLNHAINRFLLKLRLRYQSKDELQKTSDEIKKTTRFKLSSTYNFKDWKWDPTFSAEAFNGITNNDGLYKMRYTLSTNYKLNMGSLGLFIRTENELQGEHPKRTNILGVKYNFTIKKKNK